MAHDRPRLLVADADPQTRAFIDLLLGAEDYDVAEAPALEDGAGLGAEAFDLILADGCCATREAFAATAPRLLAAAGGTPVLLLSALPLAPEEARARGFRDRLPKPFAIEDLLARVRAALPALPAPADA